jgi:hypothetical protein
MTRVRACEPYGIPLGKKRLKAAMARKAGDMSDIEAWKRLMVLSTGFWADMVVPEPWSPAQGRPVLKP